jgi:hypothetical protein
MQSFRRQARLPFLPAILALFGLLAGCSGRSGTIYSPPARGFLTGAPAVRIILPKDGTNFRAHADIRLLALATPHGTDLGPEDPADLPFPVTSDKWELVQDSEDAYSVEFFAGTNSLGSQTGGLVSARMKSRPGQAMPLIMPVIGFPAVEVIWHDAPAGHYTLTARGINQNGQATVSAPVNITVLP